MEPQRPLVSAERGARGATYLLMGLVGVTIIVHFAYHPYAWPDSAISGMAGIFLLAGFPASFAAMSQRYRIEYMALPFQGGGIALYAWWLWVIASPPSSVLAIHTLISLTLFSMVVTRLCALHPLVKSRKEQAWIGPK